MTTVIVHRTNDGTTTEHEYAATALAEGVTAVTPAAPADLPAALPLEQQAQLERELRWRGLFLESAVDYEAWRALVTAAGVDPERVSDYIGPALRRPVEG